jgi:hypothetical protein
VRYVWQSPRVFYVVVKPIPAALSGTSREFESRRPPFFFKQMKAISVPTCCTVVAH